MLSRLARQLDHLPEDAQADAREVLSREEEIIRRLGVLVDRRLGGMRIRCHGDFHLGQVLFTGRDWVIIDLEGEPAVSLAERRVKRSPLSDVAGMVRSFNYVASAGVIEGGGLHRPEDRALLEPWADTWERWASSAFLGGYYETASDSGLLPASAEDRQAMLDVLVLGKALYELAYELDNRPSWVRIPLRGVLRALEPAGT
jgi:maltose alpha-D-glucosyltransferase/alpha-amylase